MTATYRAAYWISDDRQAEVVLTGPEHAELPDAELRAEAEAEAERNDIDLTIGSIEIGDWQEVGP